MKINNIKQLIKKIANKNRSKFINQKILKLFLNFYYNV